MLEIIDLTQKLDKDEYTRQVDPARRRFACWAITPSPAAAPASSSSKVGRPARAAPSTAWTERLDPRLCRPSHRRPARRRRRQALPVALRRRLPDRNIAIFDRSWYGPHHGRARRGLCAHRGVAAAHYQEIKKTLKPNWWTSAPSSQVLDPHRQGMSNCAASEDRQNRPNKAWTDEDWRNRDKWSIYEQAVEGHALSRRRPPTHRDGDRRQ